MKMSTPANAPFNEKADKPEKPMPTPSELETPQKVEDISVEKVRRDEDSLHDDSFATVHFWGNLVSTHSLLKKKKRMANLC
jgi:hypothetical protein